MRYTNRHFTNLLTYYLEMRMLAVIRHCGMRDVSVLTQKKCGALHGYRQLMCVLTKSDL